MRITILVLCLLLSKKAHAELIPYEPGGNTITPAVVGKKQLLLQSQILNYQDQFGGDGSYWINSEEMEVTGSIGA
ncbi:MAG: hypothetical protein LW817_06285 [Candidatus Caenarcaniphilales bacterium]|nr:hypothetical protein [Candidatus Caenarcaniphilales bacterium]